MNSNPDLAYAVGLITTDGNLSSDGRHITLTSSDIQLIEVFNQCMGKTNRISNNPLGSFSKKPSYKVQIGDVKLYRWLISIGLTPNKSLSLANLNVPNKYFRDFLRGHLDGDGSIIYYKDYYNTHLNPKYIYDRLFVHFISASHLHLIWLRSKIDEIIKLHGSLHIRFDKRIDYNRHSMSLLKFSTKEAKKLLNWIYYEKDLPCLKRKFNIAKPFLNICQVSPASSTKKALMPFWSQATNR